ncbi:MAG: antirestriction protein ArdA [Oscillospiraceae bacterium]|nr:antirestriction protein ArdA [Oscillospiraceae bacterium]
MSNKIKAQVIKESGSYDIILPQTQNNFNKSLINMGFYNWNHEDYRIENVRSGNQRLDEALNFSTDIEELNYLAQLLSHLNEDEMGKFNDILSADGNIPPVQQIVNMAYNINNNSFNIMRSIYDIGDLGRLYAEENDPFIDETIINNTDENGEIDHEGIGMYLQIAQGGVFSDSGYISNYDEMVKGPYDGRFFPPFRFNNETLTLGVSMSKRSGSVDIFLPAESGVIRRAERRLEATFKNCTINPCWGFPMPLSEKILPASEINTLSAVTERLSVLSPKQFHDVFDSVDKVDISSVQEFEDFCSEQIREIQMPEAVNTVTYYFPLDVKMRENNDYDYEDEDYDPDYIGSISSSDAVHYIDPILEQIKNDNSYFDTNRLLAEYINDDALNEKIYSILPTVGVHGGELWGAMVMKVAGELDPDDVAELKDYISGQNSDGYGEGFEQREIKVSDGELYVSFWSHDKKYAIYTQEEFKKLMEQKQTALEKSRITSNLPDCPIIGADSNVFNLMGIVSRTLKEHGMKEQAQEMQNRVKSSGSFNEALAIMTEYVNPVSQKEMEQSTSGSFSMNM